jgi:hypothetical protein
MTLLHILFRFSHSNDNSQGKNKNVANCLTMCMKKPMSSDTPFSSAAQGIYLLLLTSPSSLHSEYNQARENSQ